ncbi:MAG: hypothetical protein JO165_06450 [Candidatus Eremiobacteraeota bacterium]|nr:hypothetical protein [Candidatus Eremiobacteraeota bacterium]
MSAYALGGRAGWRAADTSNIDVKHALHARGAGTLRTFALDSKLPGCRWDRVRFNAKLPAGGNVAFSTYTADVDRGDTAMGLLDDGEWSPWSSVGGPMNGASDGLVRSDRGRYLWLRIALTGKPLSPAELRFVDITYPRSSSLRMLPPLYSTNAGGRDLNERLLSLFDAMRDEVKDEIRLLASVVDPRTTNAETQRDFLDWLGTWFGIEVFRSWPDHRRRAVIGRAGELFRLRGTPRGIKLFIELALGLQVQILEGYADRNWWFAPKGRLGCGILFGPQIVGRASLDEVDVLSTKTINSLPAPYLDSFASRASRMTIVVAFGNPGAGADEAAMLRALVETQKPAHVTACIIIAEANLRLGVTARLGLDSIVGTLRPPEILPGEPTLRLGVNATVGGRT